MSKLLDSTVVVYAAADQILVAVAVRAAVVHCLRCLGIAFLLPDTDPRD